MPKPGSTREVPAFSPAQERFGSIVVRVMTAANIALFRLSGGRLGNRFRGGAPVCLLTTKGRKSGRRRTVALIYLEDGDGVVVVASQGGMSRSPGWYWNLEAHPEDVEVQVGARVTPMRSRRASDEEKEKLWPQLLEVYPDYEDYQARTSRNIPVMILAPK